jgi:hypothetical protein
MKKTTMKHLILLILTTYLFLGCVKQDKVSSINAMETTKLEEPKVVSETISPPEYGQHTDEIEEFLSATPLGSEIYLEEKESGEWYLKIEKTFTVKKDEEKTENIEPIYGESILI